MTIHKTSRFQIKIYACSNMKSRRKSIYSIYCLGTNQSYIHHSLMIKTSKETSKLHEVCFAIFRHSNEIILQPRNKYSHECTVQAASKYPCHYPQCTGLLNNKDKSKIESNQVLLWKCHKLTHMNFFCTTWQATDISKDIYNIIQIYRLSE